MDMKVFSLEEANNLIPELSKMMDEIMKINQNISFITSDIKDLVNIWGDEVMDEENPDYSAYMEKIRKKDELMRLLASKAREIEKTGCIIKDPGAGLLDFYHKLPDGNIVFLCWKQGEPEIKFWHEIEAGFAGRKPLKQAALG